MSFVNENVVVLVAEKKDDLKLLDFISPYMPSKGWALLLMAFLLAVFIYKFAHGRKYIK